MMYEIAYVVSLFGLTAATAAAAVFDIKTHTIKNKFVLAVACLSAVGVFCDCMRPDSVWYKTLFSHIFGGILAFCLMIAVGLYVKGGLGGGDIKLLGAIGLWFGVYYSLAIAAVSALGYLAYCVFIEIKYIKQGREKPKTLAFGPFVGLAVTAASITQTILIFM